MLDNLRFQEVEKAIFRASNEIRYGNRCILKNEPFMIVDNADISDFSVTQRPIIGTGRSTEYSVTTIQGVSFNLIDGRVKMDLFNSIFGQEKDSQPITFTISDTVILNNLDSFELPSSPSGDVLLYLTDDYGNCTRIANNQYIVEDKTVTFIKPITKMITYIYEQSIMPKRTTSIGQLGQDLVGSLEMQCIALDVITEEKIRVLLKFDKVSISTDLSISFNNSGAASKSIVYVQALLEENQSKVNKEIFDMIIL